VAGLRSIVSAVRVPVLAIGGVGLTQVDEIAATGAAGIAAIGLFSGALPLAPLVEAVRWRFDSVATAS
jgi:thiamine monophosphate synthase